MAHVDSQTPPRRGPSLTQQIFIGLALGIVAGWLVSEYNPAAADLLPSVQPAVPAPDQDDHRAADFRDARRRDCRRGPRQGGRPDGAAGDHLLRDRHDPRARHRPRGGQRHEAWRRRQPADRPEVRDHGRRADLGSNPAPHGAGFGHQVDGRRRRAADCRLQHSLRHRARHDRREGPAGCRVVRGRRGDDVQVHEHRHALCADRRRRGDRVYGRARRAPRAGEPGLARRHALPGARRPSSCSCCCRSRSSSRCRSASSSRR